MILVNKVKSKFLKVLTLSMAPFSTGCFMMFLPAMSMTNGTSATESDPSVNAAILDLIEKSATELIFNRGQYEQILIGEVKVIGDFISTDQARMLLLKILRESDGSNIMTRSDLSKDPQNIDDFENFSQSGKIAVLEIQFYNSGGQLWQAQQLVDMRLNLLLWSGIQSIPIPGKGD